MKLLLRALRLASFCTISITLATCCVGVSMVSFWIIVGSAVCLYICGVHAGKAEKEENEIMSKFELDVNQYMVIVRHELTQRLSRRCGVHVVFDSGSNSACAERLTVCRDDWSFVVDRSFFQERCDQNMPIHICADQVIADLEREFIKQLF